MKRPISKKILSLLLSAAFVLTMPASSMPVSAAEAVESEFSTEMPSEVITETPAEVITETPSESQSETETGVTAIEEMTITETAPAVEASSYDAYKTKTSIYLRTLPDKTSTALKIIPANTTVYVTEETKLSNGDLWGKTTYSGKTGWFSLKSEYSTKVSTGSSTKHVGDTTTTTTTEATTTTTTEVTPETTEIDTTTTTQDTSETTVPTTKEETVVPTTEEGATTTTTGIWNPVDTDEGSTTSTTEETTTTTAAPETVTVYNYQVTASTLNVRSGPGTSYSCIGSLANGTTVKVTEISGSWGKINYEGKAGWICLSYCKKLSESTETKTTEVTTEKTTVTTTEGTNQTTQAASTSPKYMVTASSLNVRSGAGTSYSTIGTLSNGDIVTVTEVSSNNWGKIDYNGKTGWISLAYCEETTVSDDSDTDTTNSGWKLVNGTYVYYSNGTKLFSSNTMHTAWTKIANKSSGTNYYVVVNCSSCQVFIFKGSSGKWVPYKLWSCSPGASSTPTVKGTYTISDRGYSFGTYGSYTCYYWTRFYNGYLFHSVLYYWNSSTIKDGRLGMNLSHGCVRLAIDNAKWIYNNLYSGTKVYIY